MIRYKAWLAAAAFLAGVSIASAGLAQGANMPAIGMVTGSKTGTYIAFGHDIAQTSRDSGGPLINVYDSNGSIDNIKRITSKEKVGLAIVQSDVLGFLSRSSNPESIATAAKLRLVAPFYNEEVHILARRDIHSVQELSGKRVVVGLEGSGSMITAVNIFSILGITPKLYQIDPPHGAVAILNNDADAIVFVGGKPVKMFKNMEALAQITTGQNAGKLAEVHFLPLDDPRLLKEYRAATLMHSDYSFIPTDIPTIAVTAVLVTYDYSRGSGPYSRQQCRNMEKLAASLRDHMDELRLHGHPKWKEVDLGASVGNWKQDSCSASALNHPAVTQSGNGLEHDLLSIVRGKTP